MRKVICLAAAVVVWTLCCICAVAADEGPVAWWKFDEERGNVAADDVRKINDAIKGNFKYVAGASGKCLRFDGYTTRVVREAAQVPRLVEAFSIEAWIAPQTYSWNWTGIVDQAGGEVSEKVEAGAMVLKPGLFGAKYSDADLEDADGTGELKHVDHDWTGQWSDWSARWRGHIEAPFTGEVTFTAEADNGLKLEINKQVVIDGWGRKKARSGKISMEKGKKYPIVLWYFQDGDPSFLHLYWSWSGQAKKLVEPAVLSHSNKDEDYVRMKELGRKGETPERNERVFLGIDSEGHIGMRVMVNGELKKCVSEAVVPLLKWSHVAGTFDKDKGINIYINGKAAGSLSVSGVVTPAKGHNLLIGKSSKRMSSSHTERRPSKTILSHMIFDGLIDEVKIYGRALSAGQISSSYTACKPKVKQPLQWRKMPSGPEHVYGPFGAAYCRLRYADEWEDLWRVGPHPDILVHFDESPVRMLFWRGTAYGAVWVAENSKWMGDQSLERTGGGSPWGCAEHMSDKQCRYSRVRLIESHSARALVHWRYAVSDIKYEIFGADKDGWGEWADEYYYIYPDAVSTRKQVLHSNRLHHEWQETIVLHQPGTRPEDNIELDALTLGNMNGESYKYSWKERPRRGRMKPDNPTIQITNLKSKYRPFIIFQPNSRIKLFTGGIEDWSHFPWWNHWPVSQLPNDGRRTKVPDRPAHSSLAQSIEDSPVIKHDKEKGTFTAVSLTGMGDKDVKGLVPLARSWNNPAKLNLIGEGFKSEGYDRYQRAYVVACENKGERSTLEFALMASEESPVVNPAFVVKDWGEGGAKLEIDGKRVRRGSDFRLGHRHRLEGSDLVVWIKKESTKPIIVSLFPAGR